MISYKGWLFLMTAGPSAHSSENPSSANPPFLFLPYILLPSERLHFLEAAGFSLPAIRSLNPSRVVECFVLLPGGKVKSKASLPVDLDFCLLPLSWAGKFLS